MKSTAKKKTAKKTSPIANGADVSTLTQGQKAALTRARNKAIKEAEALRLANQSISLGTGYVEAQLAEAAVSHGASAMPVQKGDRTTPPTEVRAWGSYDRPLSRVVNVDQLRSFLDSLGNVRDELSQFGALIDARITVTIDERAPVTVTYEGYQGGTGGDWSVEL